jgi:hypothetical protein
MSRLTFFVVGMRELSLSLSLSLLAQTGLKNKKNKVLNYN